MSTSDQNDHADAQSGNSTEFPPTTVVLAKVKGYPPWPAMVLDMGLLPEYVKKKKPKAAKTTRKKATPTEVLPVRFFSDDTYIWAKSTEISPLSAQQIEAFLSKPKRRKDNVLESAYQLALDPPDMAVFVKYGSKGEPDEPELVIEYDEGEEYVDDDEVDDDDDEEEEEVEENDESGSGSDSSSSGSDTSSGSEDEESETDDGDDDDDEGFVPYKKVKTNKRKAKKVKKVAKVEKKTPAKRGRKPAAISADPDWGLEEDLERRKAENNYIYEDIDEQRRFNESIPRAEDVAKRFGTISTSFGKVSKHLIDGLLDDDIKQDQVVKNINKLKNIKLPPSMFMKSKLMRVMVLTMRRPNETFPYNKVRRSVGDYLKKLGLNIDPNPLVIEEPETEREDTAEPAVKEEPKEASPPTVQPTNGN